MKVTQKQLLERIEELEKQVRELQARPVYVPVFPKYRPNPYPYQVIPTTWYQTQPYYLSPTITNSSIQDTSNTGGIQ